MYDSLVAWNWREGSVATSIPVKESDSVLNLITGLNYDRLKLANLPEKQYLTISVLQTKYPGKLYKTYSALNVFCKWQCPQDSYYSDLALDANYLRAWATSQKEGKGRRIGEGGARWQRVWACIVLIKTFFQF
jgi:hypothetical protein